VVPQPDRDSQSRVPAPAADQIYLREDRTKKNLLFLELFFVHLFLNDLPYAGKNGPQKGKKIELLVLQELDVLAGGI
jgi:hypothetical protein